MFWVGDQLLESVGYFEYLGRVLKISDNEWQDLYKDLSKARKLLVLFRGIPWRGLEDIRKYGLFY